MKRMERNRMPRAIHEMVDRQKERRKLKYKQSREIVGSRPGRMLEPETDDDDDDEEEHVHLFISIFNILSTILFS